MHNVMCCVCIYNAVKTHLHVHVHVHAHGCTVHVITVVCIHVLVMRVHVHVYICLMKRFCQQTRGLQDNKIFIMLMITPETGCHRCVRVHVHVQHTMYVAKR